VLLFWIWWETQIRDGGTYLWLPIFDASVSVFGTWFLVCGTLLGLRVRANEPQ
jgi:hypothetical protein